VDQGIGGVKAFPSCGGVAVAVNDPCFLRQKIAVELEIFVVRRRRAAFPELHFVKDAKRKPGDLRQLASQGGFSSARVSEYGHAFHGRCGAAPKSIDLWGRA